MSQHMYIAEIALLEEKVVHLEADNIIYQEEVGRLRRRVIELEEYRIKYELMVEKQTEQSPLDRSRRVDEINNMNRRIEENNDKWVKKITMLEEKYVSSIHELEGEITKLTKELEDERNSNNNKMGLALNKKDTHYNKEQEQEKEATKLTEEIKQLRAKNTQLTQENTELKSMNVLIQQELTEITQEVHNSQLTEREVEEKVIQAKQEEKEFYREKIVEMEREIELLKQEGDYHKLRASPEREREIAKLEERIKLMEDKHLEEMIKFTELVKQKDSEISRIKEVLGLTKEESHRLVVELQERLKTAQQENFDLKHEHHFELIASREELQKIHEQEVTQMKESFTLLEHSVEKEREQWQLILNSQTEELQRIKSQWEEDKEKYKEEKAKLKQKVEELKTRLKENAESEKLKVQEETKMLLENIKLVDNEESKFTDYENGVVFLHRQLKKSMLKVEEKQREIGQLLDELKTQRDEFEEEVEFIKKTERSQVQYYKQKLLETDQQNAKLLSEIRDKEKYIRSKDEEHKGIYEKLMQENESIKNMMEEMERDYRRLTENKREIYQSYRSERDLVFTGKNELNQERKNKWLHLARQKNELEIAYKEREKQLRNQFELQINTLNEQLHKINLEKEESATELQILKEKDENEDNIVGNKKEKSEKNIKEFHKKLASLDLEINLTQNIYSTINALKARKNKRNETEQMSVASSQWNVGENIRNINEMGNMSMNSEEMERLNVSPTFSMNAPKMRGGSGMENFSFYPQEYAVKITEPEKKNSNNHSEVSFDPSKFENNEQEE